MIPLCLLGLSIAIFTCSLVYAAPADIPSASSFYVSRVPDLHQDETHPLHIYSGHLSSDPEASSLPQTIVTAHIFFLLVKARRTADKERIMFWFNGGPGCSSFDGLMMEVGPWVVDQNGGLQTREGGWEEYTTMVYIDQPAGTGYSYTSTNRYAHELSEAARQFVEFLNNFYKVFPEYSMIDTYLGGESYAGQYIPYFADAILSSQLPTPLLGIAIGNGWMDGRRQYPAYLDYAVKHGLMEENSEGYKRSKKATDQCISRLDAISGPQPVKDEYCESILTTVMENHEVVVDGNKKCINIYDIRLQDSYPACGMDWPVELKNVTKYLGRSEVVNAFHASAKAESWVECSPRVGDSLWNRESASSIILIPKILSQIPVLFFVGDQDLICNYVGIESIISAMTWNGETGLGTVITQSWSVDGIPAGTWVTSRNLTYVKVFNASHMVPYDVPHVAHDMILRFMGTNFSAITDGSARIPSSVGNDVKPIFDSDESSQPPQGNAGTNPSQDKAMWEAYYNAGSAAVVLVLIFLAIGTFLWCRLRRRKLKGVSLAWQEESIPLNVSHVDDNDDVKFRPKKGKERAQSETMFDIGDDDGDDDYRDSSRS